VALGCAGASDASRDLGVGAAWPSHRPGASLTDHAGGFPDIVQSNVLRLVLRFPFFRRTRKERLPQPVHFLWLAQVSSPQLLYFQSFEQS
jgi:hypothetical protein